MKTIWILIFIAFICMCFNIGTDKGLVYYTKKDGTEMLYSGSLSDRQKVIKAVILKDSSALTIRTELKITEDAYFSAELTDIWNNESDEAIRYALRDSTDSNHVIESKANKVLKNGSKQLIAVIY